MQKLLHANAWLSILIGGVLTVIYYILFFHQLPHDTFLMKVLIIVLVLVQIWGSVALVWMLYNLSHKTRSFVIHTFIKVISFSVLLFMLIDALTLSITNMKVSVVEGLRMVSGGMETNGIVSSQMMTMGTLILLVLLGIVYIVFWFTKARKTSKLIMNIMSVWILFAITSFYTLQQLSGPYLGSLVINPLIYNINELWTSYKNKEGPVSQGSKTYESYFHALSGSAQKKNIIVMFAESFEPKYSLASSGLHNWLPKYDAIAHDGVQYDNFLAPGCVSEHAHISFLQGLFPLNYGGSFVNEGYQKYYNYIDPLPTFFNQQGYSTIFLSTARLGFMNQAQYLKDQGYSLMIGESAFKKKRLYTFDAAPDKELYSKAIQVINNQLSGSQPFYLNMQTISTHTAWNTPYGKTEQSAWRYADDQIGEFYKELRKTKFFDNGILVIFGDHRVPVPSTLEEQKAIGPLWPSKVLATVIDGKKKQEVSSMVVQPIDLHFSLKKLVASGDIMLRDYYNDIFTNTVHRDWGLHYCKYASNQINLMQKNLVALNTQPDHEAYSFVKAFQSYQFNRTLAKTQTGVSSFADHSGRNMMVIGHGGAPAYAPIDTLSGFIFAMNHGADGVELDLSFTKDKVNVVRHGPYPSQSCIRKAYISDMLYNDMRKECKIQNGESIMTFDEFLNLTKSIVPLYFVELKVYSTGDALAQMNDAIATVKKYGLQNKIIFVSYDPIVRKQLLYQPDIRAGWDMFVGDEYPSDEDLSHIEYLLTPFYSLDDRPHVKKLLSYKKPIITYVPQTKNDMEDVLFKKDYLHIPLSGVLVDDIPLFLSVYKSSNE